MLKVVISVKLVLHLLDLDLLFKAQIDTPARALGEDLGARRAPNNL